MGGEAAPRKRAVETVWVVTVLVLAVAAAALLVLRGCTPCASDVTGVTDVSIGCGTLTVIQEGTDRLEIKADPGVAAQVMARRTGNLLELGLFDESDWRVLFLYLIPRPDPNTKLEFVLHTRSATRYAANDHGNLRMDGFKADELKLQTMSVASVVFDDSALKVGGS